MLDRIWQASERIGFLATIMCVIVWLVSGGLVVWAAGAALWQFPVLAQIVIVVIASIIGLSGLVCFWIIAGHIDYLRLGYRMRRVAGDQWLYEERTSDEAERLLPCVRLVVGEGYPAACKVQIPSAAAWDSLTPSWAKGRRAEIAQRIAHCFGHDNGGQVDFVDNDLFDVRPN